MIKVKIQKVLNARKWKVLRMIMAVEEFPKYMPNVKKCSLLQKQYRSAMTSWHIEIDDLVLKWVEKDEINISNFSVRFKAVEGDLAHFEGTWMLKDHPDKKTSVTVEVSARIGIPKVEEVIEEILAQKIKRNFEVMLEAMNDRLTIKRYRGASDRKHSDVKGFAVVGHPYNIQHLIRIIKFYNPNFNTSSQEFLKSIFNAAPAYSPHAIKQFRSAIGKKVEGKFIMCPIIPDNYALDPERVVEKVIQACKIAEESNVGIVTLGGFTSIAGERYSDRLLREVHVPITTGNAFTVAMVVDGVKKAAILMEKDISNTRVTVIGGTGDIGGTCARILARQVAEITITGRNPENLAIAKKVISLCGDAKIHTSTDNDGAVKDADIVIAAASSAATIVDINNIKTGAIVCDVGYPKNISYNSRNRQDILIFSGGLCALPAPLNLGFDLGLPSKNILYGCWAEAILLDLEEVYENFSWEKGKITFEKVDYIRAVGKKHGFEVAPFFWGDEMIPDEAVVHIAKAKPII